MAESQATVPVNARLPHRLAASARDLEILAEYEAGHSTTTIAASRETTSATVAKAIRRAGGRVRTRREANLIRVERAAEGGQAPREGQKRCRGCLLIKDLSEFHRDCRTHDGLSCRCQECKRQAFRDYLSGPGGDDKRRRYREEALFRRFGITREEYEAMHAAQNNLCAICGLPEASSYRGRLRRLSVDHDHRTGSVRRLLCACCNAGLGSFRDDPALLEKAAAYLRAHGR